jgi:hypothetical protein
MISGEAADMICHRVEGQRPGASAGDTSIFFGVKVDFCDKPSLNNPKKIRSLLDVSARTVDDDTMIKLMTHRVPRDIC